MKSEDWALPWNYNGIFRFSDPRKHAPPNRFQEVVNKAGPRFEWGIYRIREILSSQASLCLLVTMVENKLQTLSLDLNHLPVWPVLISLSAISTKHDREQVRHSYKTLLPRCFVTLFFVEGQDQYQCSYHYGHNESNGRCKYSAKFLQIYHHLSVVNRLFLDCLLENTYYDGQKFYLVILIEIVSLRMMLFITFSY